jgi:sialate O-acetylesterase
LCSRDDEFQIGQTFNEHHARYAWENYPESCNLYNTAGLPAAPFRTDNQ